MSHSPRPCHLLVTLGPTWEFIDPIRFITNRSTGTLGYLLAKESLRRGHRVTCIAGPIPHRPLRGARWMNVVSADQMYRAVKRVFSKVDVLVMSAAVSDYRVKRRFVSKVKRGKRITHFELVENRDILKEMNRKRRRQILVGFALETNQLLKNSMKKLKEKNLDLIVANALGKNNNPFGNHRVNVHLLWKDGRQRALKRISKRKLAAVLLDAIEKLGDAGAVAKW